MAQTKLLEEINSRSMYHYVTYKCGCYDVLSKVVILLLLAIIVKKLSSLQRLLRTTSANSQI